MILSCQRETSTVNYFAFLSSIRIVPYFEIFSLLQHAGNFFNLEITKCVKFCPSYFWK